MTDNDDVISLIEKANNIDSKIRDLSSLFKDLTPEEKQEASKIVSDIFGVPPITWVGKSKKKQEADFTIVVTNRKKEIMEEEEERL